MRRIGNRPATVPEPAVGLRLKTCAQVPVDNRVTPVNDGAEPAGNPAEEGS